MTNRAIVTWQPHQLRLATGSMELFLVTATEFFARDWGARAERLDRGSALRAFDGSNRTEATILLESLVRGLDGGGVPALDRCSTADLWSRIRSRIECGRVFVVQSKVAPAEARPRPSTEPAKLPPTPKPRPERRPDPERSWIEIVLVDEDDQPLPNEKYRLELPDGSYRDGTLDENGAVSVGDIDPGTCTFTLLGSRGTPTQ